MEFLKYKSLLSNLKTKIVVTFLAIFIWFYVVTENDYKYTIEIPIKPVNVRQGKIIENDIPKKAKVTFWGKGKFLLALSINQNAQVNLDLSTVEHHTKIGLSKENVLLPRSTPAEVVEIVAPDSVDVFIGNIEKKRVVVSPQVVIEPVPGYTVVGNIKMEPDSVWISGPQKYVSPTREVLTENKVYRNVKRDLKKKINLVPLTQNKINIAIEEVTLFANIQKLMEKTVSEIPVQVRNVPPGMKVIVLPSTLSLTLEGGVELLSHVTKEDIIAYIDYHRVQSTKEKDHPAYIETPQGIRYRDVKPKRFKLLIEKQKK